MEKANYLAKITVETYNGKKEISYVTPAILPYLQSYLECQIIITNTKDIQYYLNIAKKCKVFYKNFVKETKIISNCPNYHGNNAIFTTITIHGYCVNLANFLKEIKQYGDMWMHRLHYHFAVPMIHSRMNGERRNRVILRKAGYEVQYIYNRFGLLNEKIYRKINQFGKGEIVKKITLRKCNTFQNPIENLEIIVK